jgi:hypothetical protein
MAPQWIYQDLLNANGLQSDKTLSKIVGICSACWNNVFKKKLTVEDWYWEYNKTI